MIKINELEEAKHILIVTNSDAFANASAIYSYVLTLHKKVSISNSEKIDNNLSFLPWYDKLRDITPSSADYVINASDETKELYSFFKDNGIKINQKMATSLYAGVLKRYENFLAEGCDGTIFAITSELIALKAEYDVSNEFIRKRVSLATLRLKAILFSTMLLKENATKVELYLSDDDLKATGASLDDACLVMIESLNIVNVKKASLYKRDNKQKKLTLIKEI